VLAERLAAQLLSGPPAPGPVAVVGRLLAIQAQDPRGARLAVRARTRGLGASAVDRALTDERSLVVSWLNRGTLHLVRSEDLAWLHALTTPQLATGNARRLRQEGVSEAAAERGVVAIERALAAEGPLTREELRERVSAAGIPTARQALVHLLMLATLRGLIVRGPMRDGDQAFVLTHDWLGPAPAVDRDRSLAELARRYLAGHGPASDRDLAAWAGVRLTDARAGLSAIAAELAPRNDGLADLARRAPAAPIPPPRLLGPFDPLLHGWTSRELIGADAPGVVTSNGVFRAIALVGGRAAATWGLAGGVVRLSPFGPLGDETTAALDAEAADVVRFLSA
jgi:hypothetical protein